MRRVPGTPTAFLAVALCLAAAGCGGAPPPPQPVVVEQADSLDRRAHAAVRAGDHDRARGLYLDLLRLQQGVENLPGIAEATINLASVEHWRGNGAEAARLLDAIVHDPGGLFPAPLRAEASFRRAVIAADTGDRPTAAASLTEARRLCQAPCPLDAGLANLDGRLALAAGDARGALTFALAARAAADRTDSAAERADAERLAAAAEAAAGSLAPAYARMLDVLARDKALGRGGHIAADLDTLADLSTRLGRAAEAAVYRERAAAVRAALATKEATRNDGAAD